ncbi:MAG TPA: carboxypeptidase regulatory-like domain-containing protein [Bryobacteraceae bacterium]|nr:carboxypeptidase regulatory-like domain-containing protein [Bryobacteraceae bacterium]
MRTSKLAAICCLSLLAAPAWTQSFLSSITGKVIDQLSAAIPNAKVVATEIRTGVARQTVSNTNGEYLVADLVPGHYIVAISAPGFKELKSSDIILTGNQAARFDGQLQIGASSESIQVSASAPTIDTIDGQVSGVQTRDELNLLPTGLRSTLTLFMLNSYNYGAVGSGFSIGGVRATDTNYTIDGTTSNSNAFGEQVGPQTEVAFESLRDVEFRISNNSAEFGKVATVLMETRSGENQIHGSAFYSQANNALNAKNFFATKRLPSVPTMHQAAASFGGPVYIPKIYNGHNKTFFYFAWEETRFPSSAFNTASVPTDAFRNGDFSSLLADGIVITDPSTGLPFEGNKIPANRISPVAQKAQSLFYREPNFGSPDDYVNNWRGYVPRSSRFDRYSARIDHMLSASDNLSARVIVRNDPFLQPRLSNDQGTTAYNQYRRNINAYLSETHIFTPQLVNEFRIGFSRDHADLNGIHNGNEILSQLGLLGATPNAKSGTPEFDFDNFDTTYETADSFWTSQATEYLDNVTFAKGRHNLKMGVSFRRNNPNQTNNMDCDFGCFGFDGSMSGFDYADFLLGIPSSSKRNFRAPTSYGRWTDAAAYLQDDFKFTPKWTLNLGLRWEGNQAASDKNDEIYAFDPVTGGLVVPNQHSLQFISPLFPSTIPIRTAAQAGYPSALVRSHWMNFGPRVGFAYLPLAGSNFVIRGGYGIYYSPLIAANVGDQLFQGGPYGSSESFYNELVNGVPTFQFPNPFGGSADLGGQNVESLLKNLRTPYVQQWNMTAEKELPGRIVVHGTYRGYRGNQLVWRRDLNTPPASTSNNLEDNYFPYQNFFHAGINENGGIQKFNAMDLSVERKFTSGLSFQSQYTLAKNQSDAGDDGERNSTEDPFNRARDMANVSYMPRHRWVSSVLYDLPFGRGQRFGANWNRVLNGVAGGWTVSGILLEQSGQFLNVQYSGVDILHNRNRGGRPDCVVGASYYPDNQSVSLFLNRAAFALPAPGTFGDCPRNAVNGPGINSVNLSVQKTVKLHERATFRLIGAAMDALNHPIFSNPNTTITSGGFGRITGVNGSRNALGASGSRAIQIGARIDF